MDTDILIALYDKRKVIIAIVILLTFAWLMWPKKEEGNEMDKKLVP